MAQQMFRPIAAAVPSSDDVALREEIAALLAKQASAPRDMPTGTSTNQAIGHGGIQLVQALMARNARDTAVESKNQYRDHLAKTNEPLVDSLTGGDAAKRDLVAKAIAGMNPEVANQALSTNALNRALAVPDPALALRRDELDGAREDRRLARDQAKANLQEQIASRERMGQDANDLRRQLAQMQSDTQRAIADQRSADRNAALDAKKGDKAASLNTTYETFRQAADGLESALNAASTGPMVGRVPAMTGPQQTADGAVAAMAPVLKQVFRVAGEGSFSDRDQALLIEMLPTRKDLPEARTAKLKGIDKIIRAKLGMEQQAAPAPTAEAPAAAPTDLAAAAKAELARRRGGSQ